MVSPVPMAMRERQEDDLRMSGKIRKNTIKSITVSDPRAMEPSLSRRFVISKLSYVAHNIASTEQKVNND